MRCNFKSTHCKQQPQIQKVCQTYNMQMHQQSSSIWQYSDNWLQSCNTDGCPGIVRHCGLALRCQGLCNHKRARKLIKSSQWVLCDDMPACVGSMKQRAAYLNSSTVCIENGRQVAADICINRRLDEDVFEAHFNARWLDPHTAQQMEGISGAIQCSTTQEAKPAQKATPHASQLHRRHPDRCWQTTLP